MTERFCVYEGSRLLLSFASWEEAYRLLSSRVRATLGFVPTREQARAPIGGYRIECRLILPGRRNA